MTNERADFANMFAGCVFQSWVEDEGVGRSVEQRKRRMVGSVEQCREGKDALWSRVVWLLLSRF